MQVISVVRDFAMYDRLVKNNAYLQGATFTAIDNTEENLHITTRYNQFLQNYDYSQEDWFVFCHEDWEVKEDLAARLEELDKNCLYGPIGKVFGSQILRNYWNPRLLGEEHLSFIGSIAQSQKDGSQLGTAGRACANLAIVGVFDCQCLIVHSSIVKKYALCFDEKLSFDLYAEDFCITAREKFSITSRILQLECQHYSQGNVGMRYHTQFAYLCEKYCNARSFYLLPCSRNRLLGGKRYSMKKLFFILAMKINMYKIIRFFYRSEYKWDGTKQIKICKIPLPVQLFTKEK